MNLKPQPPTRRELLWLIILWSLYFLVAGLFVGLRPDNFLLAILFIVLFCYNRTTRSLAIAMIPFTLFGICYDWMRIWPNYLVNAVDVRCINEAERAIFGITTADGILTPNEFFLRHHCQLADFLSGIFYLCWVPVPIAFGLYLYFTGRRQQYAHFAWAFLFVNLIGFCGYYIHPAAPPWYVMQYGFDVIPGTPGSVAGLARFDAIIGVDLFQGIYGQNSNVFAAVPSLHAAYMLIATVYAVRSRAPFLVRLLFSCITLGIWFTAVYTSHHYVIDVLLGILTALFGITLLESLIRRLGAVRRFFAAYTAYLG